MTQLGKGTLHSAWLLHNMFLLPLYNSPYFRLKCSFKRKRNSKYNYSKLLLVVRCITTTSLRSWRFLLVGSPESRARGPKRVAKPRGNGARATRNPLVDAASPRLSVVAPAPFSPQLHHLFWHGFPAHQNRQLRRLNNNFLSSIQFR